MLFGIKDLTTNTVWILCASLMRVPYVHLRHESFNERSAQWECLTVKFTCREGNDGNRSTDSRTSQNPQLALSSRAM